MPLYNRAVILASGGVKEFWKARRNAWEGGAMHRLMAARNILRVTKNVGRFVGLTFAQRRWDMGDIKAVEKKLRILEEKGFIKCCRGRIYFLRQEKNEIDILRTIGNIVDDRFGGENYPALNKGYARLFRKVEDFSEVPSRRVEFFSRRFNGLRHPFLLSEAYDIAAAESLGNRYRKFAHTINLSNVSDNPECLERYRFIRGAIDEAKKMPPSRIMQDLLDTKVPSAAASDEKGLSIFPSNDLKSKFAVVFGDTHLMPMRHADTAEFGRFFWMVDLILQAKKIGNGDIFDIWAFGGKLEQILNANPTFIMGLVRSQSFIYIPGNHDAFMSSLLKKYDCLLRPQVIGVPKGELYDKDRRILIKHGHQMDQFNKPNAESGRIVTRAAYFLSSLLGDKYGPRFLRWAELSMLLFIPKEVWQKDRVRNTVRMVRDDFTRLNDERIKESREPFSPEKPLICIVGHQHSMGLIYAFEQVRKAIELDETLSEVERDEEGKVIGGKSKVQFFFSGTWYDKKLYAGDFIVLDLTDPEKTVVFPFCWNYTFPESFISYYKKDHATVAQKRHIFQTLVSLFRAKEEGGN